jgi:hypothetical protein
MVDELVYIQENLPRIKEEFEGRAPTPPAIEFKDGLPVVKETFTFDNEVPDVANEPPQSNFPRDVEAKLNAEAKATLEANKKAEEVKPVTAAVPSGPSEAATRMTKELNKHADKKIHINAKNASNIDIVTAAAKKVGVPADKLAAVALNESNFNANATPPKGTAKGLFQFIDETWAPLVKTHGNKYQITGKDGEKRNITIEDRNNPEANAIMGALFTKENIKKFKKELGREPTVGEVYLMHFSPGTALKILKYAEKNPNGPAIRKSEDDPNYGFSEKQARYNKNIIKKDITISQALKNLYRRIETVQSIYNKSHKEK